MMNRYARSRPARGRAACEAQLRVEPSEIKSALNEIKKQNNLDDAGLEQALAMQGYSIQSYKKDVERQIVRIRSRTSKSVNDGPLPG